MNSPSNIVPESAGVSAPGYGTRPLYWSVRRELWENRSIYIAPLIVAAFEVIGFAISTIGLAERRRAVLLLDPAHQLGAARDISLGRVANYRHPNLRENYLQHFVFRLRGEEPLNGIRAGRFRISRSRSPHDRLTCATHFGKIPGQPRSLDRARGRCSIHSGSSPAAPLSRTDLTGMTKHECRMTN